MVIPSAVVRRSTLCYSAIAVAHKFAQLNYSSNVQASCGTELGTMVLTQAPDHFRQANQAGFLAKARRRTSSSACFCCSYSASERRP